MSENSKTELVARVRAELDQYQRRLAEREEQLASQPQIEQAKGILMTVFALTEPDAFTVLVQLSQQSNIKLREVALQLVHRCQGMVSATTAASIYDAIIQLPGSIGYDR